MDLKQRLDSISSTLGLSTHLLIMVPIGSSFCLSPYGPKVIGIRSDLNKKETVDHLIHEIGHAFLAEYYGSDVIEEEDFEEYFGSFEDPYYTSAWYWGFEDYEEYEDDPEYISKYAQTHPQEDFAECFVEAWKCFKSGKRYTYGNKALNSKIKYILGCIKDVA